MGSPFFQEDPKTGRILLRLFPLDPLEGVPSDSYSIPMKHTVLFGIVTASLLSWAGGEERTFQPRTLMKPLPAIKDAPFVKAGEVKSIGDEDLVLALTLNGDARAYPINMLNGPRREIINDTLGGISIAATW
ncbi:MAG: hypothetical protein ACI9NQ_001545 [Paracoccaceae bacterium]|jgi:hypothetical protein